MINRETLINSSKELLNKSGGKITSDENDFLSSLD